MKRKIRRSRDEDVLQQVQTQGNEVRKSQLLELVFFFFNDAATTEIYTLSLHDALPISYGLSWTARVLDLTARALVYAIGDRKSTRLNSSHGYNSYAVFCLKKKKKN